ncbi:MAG: IMPACT family protein [Terasakiella sp.]|uniref:IMPACT family protein n=1 Tax=unclassified Terasakiella TaxID=2614952 RepID=UPI003B007A3C
MKTIKHSAFAETEEKKSRFLAFLLPYSMLDCELDRLRREHPKANHHVSAFRAFDTEKRLHEGAKDDGEPSGSAGMPALKVLQGHELVNVGVIIVRYFGGIKLGTGGMARAYGAAVKAVVEIADLTDFTHQASTTFCATFERISQLERLLNDSPITERRYTETGIEIEITGSEDHVAFLIQEWESLNY